MSVSTGPTSKGEKGKSKYQSLDINSIYNSTRSEASEAQTTKSTLPRKHGMQQLGKVPQRRPPANLPSLKSENSGNDPSISLVPSGVQGWGLKPGESQQLTPGVGGGNLQNNQTNQNAGQTPQSQGLTSQASPAPAAGAVAAASLPQTQAQQQASQAQQQSQDKTWSSVTGGGGIGQGGPGSGPADGGPSFLAHQSPQFRQEFPSLSGEPGAVQGLQTTPAYGPGPSLRPQTEPTSWTHTKPPSQQQQQQHPAHQPPLVPSQFKSVVPSFMMSQSSGFPMFPESIQKKSRSQASPGPHPDVNRINRMMGGPGVLRGGGGGAGGGEGEDLVMSRPIIREEELVKMDELTRDSSWAAANDDIDYNEQLSFSDGEGIEEEKDKFKDKSKQQQAIREEKKDDMDKMSRDKGFMPDRDRDRERGQQQWRSTGGGMSSSPSSNYTDFRSTVPRQLMQGGGRLDEEEIWKEKRRQMSEHKQMATERAKQRKEEEEKRYEETVRAKRNNRDDMSGGVNAPSSSDWDDRTKISGDNFRQMTQFPLESRPSLNREKERERDMRRDRDRDNQSNRYHPTRPPRFSKLKDAGSSKQAQPSWPGHPPSTFPSRRNNDQPSDDQHDRFRLREEREGKRNYYDSQSLDHGQQYHDRDYGRDYRSGAQSHHHQSDKEVCGRDVDKEQRDSPKADSDHRGFDEVRTRREPKQQNDHYEDKESDRRDRRGEYGGSRGEVSSERPSRPESRDSRASRDSDHRPLPDPSDTFHDGYLVDKIDRLSLGKDMRREPQVRGRDHVPGPITQEKLVAYEHKHSQSQLEKCEGPDKLSDDKRLQRNDGDCLTVPSQAWAEDKSPETGSQAQHAQVISPATLPGGVVASTDLARRGSADMSARTEEGKLGKSDNDSDKRKENGGERGGRDRREELGGGLKSQQQGQGGQPSGRNNRGSGRGGSHRNNSYPSKYNTYQQQQGQIWQHPKDRSRQQQSSRGGRCKHWNQSESDGSGDEVSIESGKDDKKNDKKQDGVSKMGTWKSENKERRDDKKDSKSKELGLGGGSADSDKEKMKEKKGGDSRGAGMGESSRKSGDGGGFGPRPTGEVSRRGRGGMRGQSRLGMGPPALYGPPGSKPFSSAGMGPHQTNASAQHDSHQPSSPPHHMGRKEDGGKGEKSQQRGKNARSQDENWETTSETSDGSGTKRPNKMRSRSERKIRGGLGGGTIGDKRNLLNSQQQHHINGKPDSEDRKSNKDDSDTPMMPYSNNGFQEVKSKKGGGKEGRGSKEEGNKRSRSKGKEKMGGIKGQQKAYSREFVNNKPPRMQRLDASRKQQLAQAGANSPDVSDMNKINQNVSSLFPPPRSSNAGSEVSCPPAHNAWNKPINASLRTTPPLGPTPALTQLTVATAQITQDKTTSLEELGQVGGSAPSASPTADKTIVKLNREVVDKSLLEGPPVNTIIFENTNYKREPPGDIGTLKQCFPMKPPSRPPMDKPRDRKMEEELPEGSHSLSLGGFKAAATSASDLQSPDSKQQDAMQVPMSFGKNEDTADMKLDFAFDSDLSQLSDDKTNQSMHVGQSGAADLNQKIASVKKVWDSPSSMSGHVVEESGGGGGAGGSSAFGQAFPSDKGLDPTSAPHHPDHNDFNTPESVYGSAQLTGGSGAGGGGASAYAGAASMMKGGDAIVSNTSTICKANMFQVSAQPQQMAVMTHPGPLSTPPPMANVLSYQANYSSNLSAVPSPPNVMYNSQQGSGAPPQAELYQSYSLSGAGTRSYTDFPPTYNMSQSSTFQPSVYMQSGPGPQSVFQNHNQYRMPPHGSAALSQQMSSNPSTMLMPSSTSSVVSATQVKPSQGSLQPTAIGSKSGGGPPTGAPAFPPQSTQIVLIESPSTVSFLHQGYHRPTTIQPSSSFFANSGLGPGGSTGLFNSTNLLSGGGGGAGTGSLPPSASPFGVQPGAPSQYSQQQQPTSSHQQPLYPTQPPQQPVVPQMAGGGGGFRSQPGGGYPKGGQQHPSDSAKSSQSDQFSSMFQQSVQGKGTRGMSLVKGQPQSSGSPQPQQKFSYNSAAMQAGPYQQAPPNTVPQSRQPSQQQVMRSGGGVSVGVVSSQASRYITPIQRPHPPPSYSQQQVAMLQQQVVRQQRSLQQVRGAPQQQQQPGGPPQQQQAPPQQQQPSQQPKQYYQQGGGLKPEPVEGGAKGGEAEDGGKSVQDKTSKDDLSSQQQDQ